MIAHLFLGDFEVSSETVVDPVGEGSLLNLLPRVVHAFSAERFASREHSFAAGRRHFRGREARKRSEAGSR